MMPWSRVVAPLLVALIFLAGALTDIDVPGIYPDAVNPEHLAAQAATGQAEFPRAPGTRLPAALTSPYIGMLPVYFGTPFFWLLGTTVASLRVFHALFGLGILLVGYALAQRVAGSRALAFAAMALVALDPAYLFIWRTQGAIAVAPLLWWLLGMYVLTQPRPPGTGASVGALLAAGALSGLAFYGYFHFLFLAPAAAVLAAWLAPAGQRWRALAVWAAGFVLGASPFLYGYAAWAIGAGGIEPFLAQVGAAVADINPRGRALSVGDTAAKVVELFALAVGGHAVEGLMLASDHISAVHVTFTRIAAVLALAGIAVAWLRRDRPGAVAAGVLSLALVFYYVLAAPFVGRMWAHHFMLLVPLVYIAAAGTLGSLAAVVSPILHIGSRGRVVAALALAAVFLPLAVSHLFEQGRIRSALRATGGVGNFSDAINRLGVEVGRLPSTLYVVSEWGIYMPLAFLAAGASELSTTVDAPRARAALCAGRRVVSVHWPGDDLSARVAATGAALGLSVVGTIEYPQRDGVVAIVVAEYARPPGAAACPPS